MRVLVTGATGFVGGALVPRLLEDGHRVRCLVRDPARLVGPWRDDVDIVTGRVEDDQAVFRAADGCGLAYYLVHSIEGAIGGLVDRERRAAAAFRDGAELAGVRRIVYLGGLVDEADLSRTSVHLYARQQAGEELRCGQVPVTELRAGIVLGAGSASFDLLRAAARAPVYLWAPWSDSKTQPIALSDLLALLRTVAEDPRAAGQVLDIAGPDVVSYGDLVRAVRAELGLRPARVLRVPYLPPEATVGAAAVAAGVDTTLALGLLQSARVDAIVRDEHARALYPRLATTGVRAAVRDAVLAAASSAARSTGQADADRPQAPA